MIFLPALLLVSLFASLFCVFMLCRDDFVLARKNITLERVFNIFFLTSLAMLLGARIVYVVFHFTQAYLNPIVFFLFPYFPGLSQVGAFIAGLVFLFVYAKQRKLPAMRLFDFFTLSWLCGLSVGSTIIALSFLFEARIQSPLILAPLLYIAFFIVGSTYLLPRQKRDQLREGSLSAFCIIGFCASKFLVDILLQKGTITAKSFELFFLGVLLFVALGFLIRQENLMGWFKRFSQ